MAERLLQQALAKEEAPLNEIAVISAGVSAYPDCPATSHAVKAVEVDGIDLSDHRSQYLDRKMVKEASLILVMTEMHRIAIEEEHGNLETPVLLWREFMPTDRQVADPYGFALGTYKDTREAIAEAIPSIVDYIKKELVK